MLFCDDRPQARSATVARLVDAGWLKHPARGIYVYPPGRPRDGYTLELLTRNLRRFKYNYVSLESALSEWGTIEFTQTARSVRDILNHTIVDDRRPLPITSPEAAWSDLKHVGRNTHMFDQEELAEIIQGRDEAMRRTPASD